METNKMYRIEKCVSDDITREAMTHIHADKENKCLVSTNGHIVAIVPAEFDETDTTGYISANAYKAGIKAIRVEPTTDDNKAFGVLMPVRIKNEKREEFENAKKHFEAIRANEVSNV